MATFRVAYALVLALVLLGTLSAQGAGNTTQNFTASGNTNANISIENLSVPLNITQHAPIPISMRIINNGALATSNVILHVSSFGAAGFNQTFYLAALSPGQINYISMYLNSHSTTTGSYIIRLNASYSVNGTIRTSNTVFSTYQVLGSGALSLANTITTNLPNIDVSYIPYYNYLLPGQSFVSQLSIKNTGNTPVYVSANVPGSFSNVLTLSTYTLYLTPGQEISSSLLFKPNNTANIYTVPINITELGSNGSKTSAIQYMQFLVTNESPQSTTLLERITLRNNSNQSSTTLQMQSPENLDISNGELQVTIPATAAPSVSDVNTYGQESYISMINNSYVISWPVKSLPQNQLEFFYYYINSLQNKTALRGTQVLFSSLSDIPAEDLFRISNLGVPVLYKNTTGTLTFDLVYTGAQAAQATLLFTTKHGLSVQTTAKTVELMPNEFLPTKVNITTGNVSGTQLLGLSIVSQGSNLTYSIPITVLTRAPSIEDLILQQLYGFKYIIAIIILVIIAVLYLAKRKPKRQEYDPQKVKKLISLREQINRGETGDRE